MVVRGLRRSRGKTKISAAKTSHPSAQEDCGKAVCACVCYDKADGINVTPTLRGRVGGAVSCTLPWWLQSLPPPLFPHVCLLAAVRHWPPAPAAHKWRIDRTLRVALPWRHAASPGLGASERSLLMEASVCLTRRLFTACLWMRAWPTAGRPVNARRRRPLRQTSHTFLANSGGCVCAMFSLGVSPPFCAVYVF